MKSLRVVVLQDVHGLLRGLERRAVREAPVLVVHEQDDLLPPAAVLVHPTDALLEIEDEVLHVALEVVGVLQRRLEVQQRVTLLVEAPRVHLPGGVLPLDRLPPAGVHLVQSEGLPPGERVLEHVGGLLDVEVPGSEVSQQTAVVDGEVPDSLREGQKRPVGAPPPTLSSE